jgi:two-component system, OmpR family, response regulator
MTGDYCLGELAARPTRVLLADCDPIMRHTIAKYLEDNSIRAIVVSGPKEMDRRIVSEDPDLVVLDLCFNGGSGFDVLRDLRSHSDVPVIVATGLRCEEVDRVTGLEMGADDYLVKPFGLRELLARIHAVLRRRRFRVEREDHRYRWSRFGGWLLDRRTRRLTDPAGLPIALTKRQYALLLAFVDSPQQPLTREHLLQFTRGHEDIFDRSIDVQVLRLRGKLEVDPSMPQMIQTVRGIGYTFALTVEHG